MAHIRASFFINELLKFQQLRHFLEYYFLKFSRHGTRKMNDGRKFSAGINGPTGFQEEGEYTNLPSREKAIKQIAREMAKARVILLPFL